MPLGNYLRRKTALKPDSHHFNVALKISALIVGLAVFFLISLFFFQAPVIGIKTETLQKTFLTRKKSLQNELISIHAKNGLPEQIAKSFENTPFPQSQKLIAFVNSKGMSVFNAESEAVNQDYQQARNSAHNYEKEPFYVYLEFLMSNPKYVRADLKYARFITAADELIRELHAQSGKMPLPLNSTVQKANPLSEFYALSRFSLNSLIARNDNTGAIINRLSVILMMADIQLRSDDPSVCNYEYAFSSIMDTVNSTKLKPSELERISAMVSAAAEKNCFDPHWLFFVERARMLQSFERIRLNGMRLYLNQPKPETAMLDSVRELDASGFFDSVKSMARDFIYDVDQDEIHSLALYKGALENRNLAYCDFKKTFPLVSGSDQMLMYLSTREKLEKTVLEFSKIRASFDALDYALKVRLGKPVRNIRTCPLTGRRYAIKVSASNVSVYDGVSSEPLVELSLK